MLRTKLGLDDGLFLEQLCTVSGAPRSARLVGERRLLRSSGGGGFAARGCRPDAGTGRCAPNLTFDHAEIVARAVKRLQAKTGYSHLPGFLLPETFTLQELQGVYECVLGRKLDQSVFRRRMDQRGLIVLVPDGFRKGGRHRPAQLCRLTESGASLHDRAIAQRPRGKDTKC